MKRKVGALALFSTLAFLLPTFCLAGLSGGGAAGSLYDQYGTLYSASTWSDLTGFTANGTTPTVVSNKLQFTGGDGTYGKTFDYSYYTALAKWKLTGRFLVGTKGGSSFGVGLGIRSVSTSNAIDLVGRINLTTSGSTGTLYIDSGASHANVATSSSTVSTTAGDYIVLTMERDDDLVTVRCYNDTTHSAESLYLLPFRRLLSANRHPAEHRPLLSLQFRRHADTR
jgi:hypothetical protein